MESRKLTEFCKGRFARLADVLEGVEVNDWADLDAMEAAGLVPDTLRALAAAFHRYLGKNGLFELAQAQEEQDSVAELRRGGMVLDLTRMVTSRVMPGGRHLGNVARELDAHVLSKVARVDLRYCSLMDVDAEDVVTLCQMLRDAGAHDVVMDVSRNRFGPDSILQFAEACGTGVVSFLVCPELYHLGSIGPLSNAPAAFFDHFIFIGSIILRCGGWEYVVPDTARERVKAAHELYYSLA